MTTPQGGVNLGSAYGSITINDNIDAAIGKATQSFDNALSAIGGRMEQLGNRMTDIGGKLTLVSAPLALFGRQGVRAAANFEDALAEIQARAGLLPEQLEEVRETALRLGADTAFSTQQAADAFLQLLTAGLDTEQALATLPHVLVGAAAAGADLGQTADQVTNIMSSFQLEAAEAERIIENMNRAAAASPAEMAEMGAALTDVGGDARSFGLNLEQTSAALAILAQNGKRGTEASTQLRSIFTAMTSTTENTAKAWDMVNSSLFDASGNTRDFSVVLAEVKAGLENLNAEDQAFVVQQLAGSYGRVGFNALLASNGIDAMIDTMSEQASAADVAEARLDTFNGRVESMMGSLEALQIVAFTPFNEWLKTIVERATEVINVFTAWVSSNQDIVQPILKVVSVLLLIGPALLLLGPIVAMIGASFGVLGTVFTFLANPMLLVAKLLAIVGAAISFLLSPIGLAIAGVTLLGLAWKKNFMGIRDVVRRVVGFVREAFNILVFRDFKALGSGLYEDNPIWNFFYDLHDRIAPVVQGITHLIRTFAGDIGQFGLGEAFLGIFGQGSFGETMESSLEGALTMMGVSRERAIEIVNAIWTAIEPIVNAVTSVFDAFGNAFTVFTSTLQSGEGIFTSLDFAIQTFFGSLGVGAPIISVVRSAVIDFINTISGLWDALQEGGVSGAATFLYDNVFLPLVENIKSIDWGKIALDIVGAIGTAFTTVVSWATWVMDNLLMPIVSYIGDAVASVDWGAVGSSIMSALGTAFTTLISWATWIYDNILTPIVSYAAEAIESIDWGQVGYSLVNAIGSAIKLTFDFVAWIMDSLFGPVTENAQGASDGIDWSGVGSTIMNAIGTAISTVWDFIAWFGEVVVLPLIAGAITAIADHDWSGTGTGIMDAIKNALPDIWQWVNTNIIQPITNALANFNPMDLVSGVGDVFSSGWNNLQSFGSQVSGALSGRDSGGRGQAGMPYLIGAGAQPELFIPDSAGTFYPNADEMMGTRIEFQPGAIVIQANSEPEGRAAAQGFEPRLMEILRST